MMGITEIKENKLKMILRFSIPSIAAMLLETVITITDGYFTGNYVGENALAACNGIQKASEHFTGRFQEEK